MAMRLCMPARYQWYTGQCARPGAAGASHRPLWLVWLKMKMLSASRGQYRALPINAGQAWATPDHALSERERQVLEGIAAGEALGDIANPHRLEARVRPAHRQQRRVAQQLIEAAEQAVAGAGDHRRPEQRPVEA